MTGDQAMGLTGAAGSLVLVGAALLARRLPARTVWRLALTWAGIFLALFLVVRLFPKLVAYFT